ncbi:hypothetical protein PybrP1_002839 [[Pythium] brassicae (nom. inval.)]|nr:hypothetical protein PybrP1_002839 [[Pythium] brassicae (nom. inval.)]
MVSVFPPPSLSALQIVGVFAALLLAVITAPLLRTARRKLRIVRAIAPIPGPTGVPLLGMLPALLRNLPRIYHFHEELTKQFGGGRIKLPVTLFTDGLIYLTDPADIEHILSTNFGNYVKSQHFIDSAGSTFGRSLFGLNHAHCADGGAMFVLQRKVAAKVFTAANFRRFSAQVFGRYAREAADSIAQRSRGAVCDMSVLSGQYTMQSIFDIACGVPLRDVDPSLGRGFSDAMAFVVRDSVDRILLKPYFKYLAWCLPSEYRRRRCEATIDALADSLLAARLRECDKALAGRADILSLFIRKARELGGAAGAAVLHPPTLRSIFLTFVIAGWDTTASAITYTFYELARHPAAQQQVVAELREHQVGADADDDVISYDGLKQLRYLDAVVSEAMRLHPTVPANIKVAAADDYLPDGTFVPAGVELLYNTFYMGRNSPVWGDDPLAFRPERWLAMKTRPSAYAFPVFQAGPRACPGRAMALLETKLFVATLLSRYAVRLLPDDACAQAAGGDRDYVFSATMVMKDGLPLQFTPRAASAF